MDTMHPAAASPDTRADHWFDDVLVVPDRLTTATQSRIGAVAVLSVAVLVIANAVRAGTSGSSVAVAAAISLAISVIRWTPTSDHDVQRPMPASVNALTLAAVVELALLALAEPTRVSTLAGPMVTASCLSVYFACWGFRSLYLLRRVVLLSVLCWTPVANGVHEVMGRSLQQLSDLVYQRLAALPLLEVGDHPWRLYSAMSYRGTGVVIAVAVIGVAAARRRVTVGFAAQLAATGFIALIVHHALVLAAPIDQYDSGWFARLVTTPWTGIAIGGAAVAIVAAASALRGGPGEQEHTSGASSVVADRDPVIFGVHRGGGAGLPLVRLMQRCAIAAPVILLAAVMTSGR